MAKAQGQEISDRDSEEMIKNRKQIEKELEDVGGDDGFHEPASDVGSENDYMYMEEDHYAIWVRKRADAMLRSAAQHSMKAAKIASLLEAENPFTTVLEAIKQMLSVISEEGEMAP